MQYFGYPLYEQLYQRLILFTSRMAYIPKYVLC